MVDVALNCQTLHVAVASDSSIAELSSSVAALCGTDQAVNLWHVTFNARRCAEEERVASFPSKLSTTEKRTADGSGLRAVLGNAPLSFGQFSMSLDGTVVGATAREARAAAGKREVRDARRAVSAAEAELRAARAAEDESATASAAEATALRRERAEAMLRSAISTEEVVQRFAFSSPTMLGVLCNGLRATVAEQQRALVGQQRDLDRCRVEADAQRSANDDLCVATMQLRSAVAASGSATFALSEEARCEIEASILEAQEATLEAARIERFEAQREAAALRAELDALKQSTAQRGVAAQLAALREERDTLRDRAQCVPAVLSVQSSGLSNSHTLGLADLLGIYTISTTQRGAGGGVCWDRALPPRCALLADSAAAEDDDDKVDASRAFLFRSSGGDWLIGRGGRGMAKGHGWVSSTTAACSPLGLRWRVWNTLTDEWETDDGFEVCEL